MNGDILELSFTIHVMRVVLDTGVTAGALLKQEQDEPGLLGSGTKVRFMTLPPEEGRFVHSTTIGGSI